MEHRYIVTLEITLLEVGKTYAELPPHLTLMSRFFSDLEPTELVIALKPLFMHSKPIHLIFSKTTALGPRKQTVHLIEHSIEISNLHNELRALLDSIQVSYEYPQFVGEKHRPHVTQREGQTFISGGRLLADHCYLIEIVDGHRVIRSRFRLAA